MKQDSYIKKKNVIKKIREAFPKAFRGKTLEKKDLANIAFSDKNKLRVLEKIIYKDLSKVKREWIRRQLRNRENIIVIDVPLLYEKDNIEKYDKVIVITCSEKIRRIRVLKREGWDCNRYDLTNKNQLSDKRKKRLADIVIYSDRGKRYVYKSINRIFKKIPNMIKRSDDKIIYAFRK